MAVIHTPHGDTNALGNAQAGVDDGGIVCRLLRELVGVSWHWNSNVEFGNGDFCNTGIGKLVERGSDAGNGTIVKDQMCLGADTIDGNIGSSEAVHEGNHSGELGAGVVEVVVVDVELCSGVCGLCCTESNVDELFSEEAVENRVTPSTVFFKDFVDDILN